HYKLAMSLTSDTYGELLTSAQGMITKYDEIRGNEGNPDYLVFAPNQQFPNLTNRDIIKNAVKIDGSWNDVLDNIPDFEDFVMDNGFFPSGTYTFTFYLHDLSTGEIFSDSDVMIIYNDMQVNLLAPGTEVTSGQTVDLLLPLSDNTPTFAWQSSATWYELTIWELDPSIYQTVTLYDLPDPIVVLEDLPQQYYQYDSSLPELKDQYIYVWNVIGDFTSTLGMENQSSEYYGFKFQSSGDGGGDPNVENLIVNLAAMGLLDPGQLGNYTPTGQVYVNGVLITVDNISEFLTGLFNGDYVIESIVIE
ncbi:MAG: hypothetical protein H8E22_07360, partial [Candidatus Cloacimonetes bacterium]|nr:hypothetical protein [Candidatus Cloacimonadota bacterium]